MDPITCLGVAGAAVQFLDFSLELVSKGVHLYRGGQLSVHLEAEEATNDLLSLTAKFERPLYPSGVVPSSATENELELQTLCEECSVAAKELIEKLNLLVVQKGKIWQSFRQALLSVWKKRSLSKFEERLSRYRRQIDSRMIGCILDRLGSSSLQESRRFEQLDLRTKQIVAALLDTQQPGNNNSENRLENRITALSQLLTRLEVVLQPFDDPNEKRVVINISALPDLLSRPEEEQASIRKVHRKENVINDRVVKSIVESLWFPSIRHRIESLTEAHRNTFNWIFQDKSATENDVPWSNFVDWLGNGEGIYWINGKAGSGKSMLMKYLCEDSRTRNHLRKWAKETDLFVANYFFWNSGTDLQKNQIGLLRSILHDALDRFPNLVPIVLSSQWAMAVASDSGKEDDFTEKKAQAWTLPVLLQAFKALISQEELPNKICLLIDGLDEYDGDYGDIVELFGQTTISKHVKICLSSRPEVEFTNAYSNSTIPSLALHHLTEHDIRRYIDDKLENHPRMRDLTMKEPIRTHELVSEIVNTANGVFLWVTLTVASLLKGLAKHDQFSDLQTRIRMLPPTLEDLFDQMVLRVEDVYKERASKLYQLVGATHEHRERWREQHSQEIDPITVLEVYFAQNDDLNPASNAISRSLSKEEVISKCKDVDIWLKSWCGGLLEISHVGLQRWIGPEMSIGYLHRTVRDYLVKRDTKSELQKRVASSFVPTLSIFRGIVFRMNSPGYYSGLSHHQYMLRRAMFFARCAEEDSAIIEVDKLWLINTRIQERYSGQTPNLDDLGGFFDRPIVSGLKLYLKQKLTSVKSTNGFIGGPDRKPLLDYALDTAPNLRPSILSTLLKLKANPNQIFTSDTPWQRLLYKIFNSLQDSSPCESLGNKESKKGRVQMEWIPCLTVFLRYGANVFIPLSECTSDSKILKNTKCFLAIDCIDKQLDGFDNEEVVEFREQLRRSKRSQGWMRILSASARAKRLGRAREIA